MEKDTLVLPSLSPVGDKPIMIDARCTSADGGVLLFQDVERRLNLANRLAACLHDPRQPGKITHPLDEILRFRMLAIVAGYPDGNDVLRDDPAFKMALRRFRGRRSAHSPPAWRTCRGARNSIAWRCSTCIATAFRLCPIISPLISTRASIGASRNYASSTPITMTGASCRSTSSTPAAGVRAAGGGDAERDPDAGQAGGRSYPRALSSGPDPPAGRQPLCLSGSDDPPIALRSGPEDTEARLCRGCDATGLEYIFGLSGNATLAARVQALEARTGARYAARCAAEPPKFKLRRYKDFRGSPGTASAGSGRSRTRRGRYPLHRHQPSPGTGALRAEILPERENLLKSFTWPPPPAREPAPTRSGSFCMAPPIGCSGPSRASCQSGRPGACSTPCATG
jgi:hypothetical protein